MIDPVGQVWTPFASARGDVYSYEDATNPAFNNPVVAIPDDTALRGQVVGGMLYSYPFVAHTRNASHVVEPTAQIIVRPNKIDQGKLPVEDAKSLVFDDTLLFEVEQTGGACHTGYESCFFQELDQAGLPKPIAEEPLFDAAKTYGS